MRSSSKAALMLRREKEKSIDDLEKAYKSKQTQEVDCRMDLLKFLKRSSAEIFMREYSAMSKPKSNYFFGKGDCALAYREYLSNVSDFHDTVLIFISMESVWTEKFVSEMAVKYNLSSYILDLRGRGDSQGSRAYLRNFDIAHHDITIFIDTIKSKLKAPCKILLVGALCTSALVLSYDEFKSKSTVDGYIIISPVWRASKDTLKNVYGIVDLEKYREMLKKSSNYFCSVKIDNLHLELAPNFNKNVSLTFIKEVELVQLSSLIKNISKPSILLYPDENEFGPSHNHIVINSSKNCKAVSIKNACLLEAISAAPVIIKDWIETHNFKSKFIPRKIVLDVDKVPIAEKLNETLSNHSLIFRNLAVAKELSLKAGTLQKDYKFIINSKSRNSLAFQEFVPEKRNNHQSIPATLILVMDTILSYWMQSFSNHFQVRILRVDPSGIGQSSGPRGFVFQKNDLYRDVAKFIRYASLNYRPTQIFIGGHGPGASLALNYVLTQRSEFINGCILIAPIENPWNGTLSTKILYDLLSSGSDNDDDGGMEWKRCFDPEFQKISKSLLGSATREFLSAITCDNIDQKLLHTTKPFCLVYGENDQTMNVKAIAELLHKASLTKNSQEFVQVKNKSHVDVVSSIHDCLGKWLMTLLQKTKSSSRTELIFNSSIFEFKNLRVIGKGAFGTVYLSIHIATSKLVAVKTIKKSLLQDKRIAKYVEREIELLKTIDSAFIVDYYGHFSDENSFNIVTKYLPGGDLFTQLKLQKKFSIKSAKFYVAEIVVAIETLHQHGIIYRDLKLENIILDEGGHLTLVDFGLSKKLAGVNDKLFKSFCGSPFYVAPEIVLNIPYCKAVDVWGLGVIAFELLSGYPPFRGDNSSKIYEAILKNEIEFPSFFTEDSIDFITSLTFKNSEDRLGCMNVDIDWNLIKKHTWFSGVNWSLAALKELPVPAVVQLPIEHCSVSPSSILLEECFV